MIKLLAFQISSQMFESFLNIFVALVLSAEWYAISYSNISFVSVLAISNHVHRICSTSSALNKIRAHACLLQKIVLFDLVFVFCTKVAQLTAWKD